MNYLNVFIFDNTVISYAKKGIMITIYLLGDEMGTVQLSEMIKKRKSKLGLTIQVISNKSGVAERTVNRVLAGEDVRYSSLLAVLAVLDLSISVHAA